MPIPTDAAETLTHRLILPRDANHYGTLFAGSVMAIALEAAYASAFRLIGASANLVLKRVLDLRCLQPVKVGSFIEIRAREIHRARAMVVIGLYGTPLPGQNQPWLDALMQFVQVDAQGRPIALEGLEPEPLHPLSSPWTPYIDRTIKLLSVRG